MLIIIIALLVVSAVWCLVHATMLHIRSARITPRNTATFNYDLISANDALWSQHKY